MAPDVVEQSPWIATLPAVPLGDTHFVATEADVAVIGGGIAGMTSALLLQRAGRSVVLLEANRIGHGVTTQSTVKVTVGHGVALQQIDRRLGRQATLEYAMANSAGMLTILDLAQELGIDCDLQIGPHVVYAEDEQTAERVRTEAAITHELGLSTRLSQWAPLPFDVAAALTFEQQAQFHPGAYLVGLAAAFVHGGGRIMEGTPERSAWTRPTRAP